MRGATPTITNAFAVPTNFNPRAPCGARLQPSYHLLSFILFQSTRPMRGATGHRCSNSQPWHYFNPRAPCGARLFPFSEKFAYINISIHAPHAGRDLVNAQIALLEQISIHAPHAGRDCFQLLMVTTVCDFNPRAPCGARRIPRFPHRSHNYNFNPRAPCGARRFKKMYDRVASGISIHAPHAGRDSHNQPYIRLNRYFNPRAPCGARPPTCQCGFQSQGFQSTRPMRGATAKVYKITLHTFATKGNS